MGYPDFVCMGFQKSGTTTLFELFKQHPQMVLCRDVKEPMYYRVPFWSILGKRYYRWRYFKHVPKHDTRLKGEINAGLTFTGCAKKIIRDYDADTKMIFMMRNPVDRCYSAYKYFLARGFLPGRFVRFDTRHGHAEGFDHYVRYILEHERHRSQIMKKRLKYLVLSQSNYAACIEEFLPKFYINNMKFVIFEEFVKNEHLACKELYDFLGVDDLSDINYSVKSNEGKERAMSSLWAKYFMIMKGSNYFLYDLCNMSHWAPGLYKIFLRHYKWVRKNAMYKDTDNSRVLDKTRAYLMEYFEDDICRLEALSDRDLHAIWQ